MKVLSERLANTVLIAKDKLLALDPKYVSLKSDPSKWSKKEILGHLIDSAVNNHRRFIIAQYQENLIFDGYVQDKWVELQDYQNADWNEIVHLWSQHNLHLARIIDRIPEEILSRSIAKHNFDQIAFRTIPSDQSSTLGFFISDYIDHLEHHIKQIFEV